MDVRRDDDEATLTNRNMLQQRGTRWPPTAGWLAVQYELVVVSGYPQLTPTRRRLLSYGRQLTGQRFDRLVRRRGRRHVTLARLQAARLVLSSSANQHQNNWQL